MHKARAAAKTAKAMTVQADKITELEAKVDRLLELVGQLVAQNGVKPARKTARDVPNDD